jgi:hypothetical protein
MNLATDSPFASGREGLVQVNITQRFTGADTLQPLESGLGMFIAPASSVTSFERLRPSSFLVRSEIGFAPVCG